MISHTIIELSDAKSIELNKKEAMRYLGVCKGNDATEALIDEVASDVYKSVSFKAVYTCVDISVSGENIDMGFLSVKSKSLSKNLMGCNKAYIFGATLGIENDRAITREFKLNTSRASVFDCISNALIESFCDYVNEYLGKNNNLRPRFSPGYGDFSIEKQNKKK